VGQIAEHVLAQREMRRVRDVNRASVLLVYERFVLSLGRGCNRARDSFCLRSSLMTLGRCSGTSTEAPLTLSTK